jgi:inorganic pyrophosphatase
MTDISRLPHTLDAKKYQCRVVVETPRGSRIKFKFEPDSGMFEISKFLPKGFVFPFEFGFVPATVAEDGDPLDVIVLMDEPAHVGCLLLVRLVGVLELVQTENGKKTSDPRLVAIPVQSFDYADMRRLEDLNKDLRQQMIEFLELYNKNAGKQDKVTGTGTPQRAVDLIEEASQRLQDRHP